jgi:hypothetical protein
MSSFYDYLAIERYLPTTFSWINLFLPFFVGILVMNILIAFTFPVFKTAAAPDGLYSLNNPTPYYNNLILFRSFMNTLLSLFVLLVVYAVPFYQMGTEIGRKNYNGVYGYILPLLLINLVLYAIKVMVNSFTKYNYNSSAYPYGFTYCPKTADKNESVNSAYLSCKRTQWQTGRDMTLMTISDFVKDLTIVGNYDIGNFRGIGSGLVGSIGSILNDGGPSIPITTTSNSEGGFYGGSVFFVCLVLFATLLAGAMSK